MLRQTQIELLKCDNKNLPSVAYFNTIELSVKRKRLTGLKLVGLTHENPTLDPLAVLHLDNQL